MSNREVTPRIAIIKRATKLSVEGAGGLELAAQVTTAGKSQLGRCQSNNEGDTISARDMLALDEINLDRAGPLHLRAFARLLNHAVVALPTATDDDQGGLAESVIALSAELGDVSRKIGILLADGIANDEEQAIDVLDELDQLNHVSAALRLKVIARRDAARDLKRRKRGKSGG